MHISVEVYSERVSTGERRHTHTAHVVFVAVDEQGKPKRVPRLIPETDEERERYARAEAHRQQQATAVTARPVAMVLSGGGAKTAAHLGACRAVKEAGFEPAWYRGHVHGGGDRGWARQRSGQ